jgi:hypothetical protein
LSGFERSILIRPEAEIEQGGPVALDLEEVDLVDAEAVRFNVCEARGVSVLHPLTSGSGFCGNEIAQKQAPINVEGRN